MRITGQRLMDMEPVHMSATLRRFTNQTIPNSTMTPLAWTSEDEDTGGGHDNAVNPDRLYVPYTGRYLLSTSIPWADNANGRRSGTFSINDAAIKSNGGSEHINAATDCVLHFARVLRVAAGDYVNVWVFQTSGGPLDTDPTVNDGPSFTVDYLGP
ncbi:hypothetical protein [Actinocorallia libanotica]